MATAEEEFTNPIRLQSGDFSSHDGKSGPMSPAAFEDENVKPSSFEQEQSTFEHENVPGSTDAWGQLAAGKALYTGDIDQAILVRLARAKIAPSTVCQTRL